MLVSNEFRCWADRSTPMGHILHLFVQSLSTYADREISLDSILLSLLMFEQLKWYFGWLDCNRLLNAEYQKTSERLDWIRPHVYICMWIIELVLGFQRTSWQIAQKYSHHESLCGRGKMQKTCMSLNQYYRTKCLKITNIVVTKACENTHKNILKQTWYALYLANKWTFQQVQTNKLRNLMPLLWNSFMHVIPLFA